MGKNDAIKDYHVRLSKVDFEKLSTKIKKTGLSKQEYGYRCLMNKKIVIIEGIPELTNQIRKIGININQVVHLANENKYIKEQQVNELIEQLGGIWGTLNNFISTNKD